MAQLELDHHLTNTDENHPALSSVPTPPGPELDQNRYLSTLPPPPVFSPLAHHDSLHSESNHDISDDISTEHSSHLVNDPDLTLVSSLNNSTHGSIEPQTPEPVAPNLSFINFVTGQTPSLSLGHELGEGENKINHTTDEEGMLDRSADLSTEDVRVHDDDDRPSIASPEDHILSTDTQLGEQDPFVEAHDHKQLLPDSHLAHPPQSQKQLPISRQSESSTPEDWLDISRPEFQFAIGLFAVPWSSLIIFFRLINQLSVLVFSQPILTPLAGILTSILAPALLYGSLITLFITSFDHHHYLARY